MNQFLCDTWGFSNMIGNTFLSFYIIGDFDGEDEDTHNW